MNNVQNIKIGLLGCGTVGQGVYNLLQMNRDKYQPVLNNTNLVITKILVNDINKKRPNI